ncbi:hypothetical protein [uncultured Draconibacterium sp.]|uniref:hypothetical protein n=1 Tax=uncultured Draconibacterium sp. TaxID=1573823 RepID=UPI00321735C8
MSKIYSIIIAVLLSVSGFAQSPEKMSYQAVIRNSSDALVINTQIGMQISILQGSANGTAVYIETQEPTTNANGLVSLEIGAGTTNDDFTSIDWANGPYFIKTETDPTGGISYTITGTSQLLSVPYALHAKTAETILGGITETDPTFTAWDKSTGISVTEGQISDLQAYLTAEVDPQFASWDKATGIVITESQISDLQTYLTVETDPAFTAWDKSTGISVTESQISDLQAYLTAEVDPQFAAWNKATGIVITESQISDLQTYITVETDPTFTAWDKSTGISVTESQISDLQAYLTAEVDPQFASWDKATGIVITESQISDLQTYLTVETDPTFTAWDKSTGISVAESQISDLQAYLTAEVDPQFASWDKATGIVITESQISDLQTYLTVETDPTFTAWDKSTGISVTESQISDLNHFTTADETDPVFGASVASGITATDTTNWNNKLDNEIDPTFTAWDKSTGVSVAESQISDLNHFTTADETDPVFGASVAGGITATDTTNWNNKLDSYTETDPEFTSWDKDYADLTNKPTVISDFTMDANAQNITNLASPVNAQDAATKAYIDNLIIKVGATSKLLALGFSVQQLIDGGQTASDLISAGISLSELITAGFTESEFIGSPYQGGIIAYISQAGDPGYVAGEIHGLIAASTDQSASVQWSNGLDGFLNINNDGLYAGKTNTALIIDALRASNPTGNYAANICDSYFVMEDGVGYSDWYLPSVFELNLLYAQKDAIGSFDGSTCYWSSCETDFSTFGMIFIKNFRTEEVSVDGKMNNYRVRAVRAF